MPAQKNPGCPTSGRLCQKWEFLDLKAAKKPLQNSDRILQSRAVPRRVSRRRRSPRPQLPKRQVAAQDGDSRRTERIRERSQQRSLRVSPGAVRQNETFLGWIPGNVQKSANAWFNGVVDEWMCDRTRQAPILNRVSEGRSSSRFF